MASPERSDWSKETIRHWILISGVTGLTVTGGGTIDGNGKIWWQNSCKTNSKLPCTEAPTVRVLTPLLTTMNIPMQQQNLDDILSHKLCLIFTYRRH